MAQRQMRRDQRGKRDLGPVMIRPRLAWSALLLAVLALLPVSAMAETPEFDRPGIAFATSTLPAGTFDWEQGLPDVQRDTADGVRTSRYSADTTLRIGLASNLEIQFAGSAWNRLDVRSGGTATRNEGGGDTTVAMKWAPALATKHVSMALLGGVTLTTGDSAFTNGRPAYSLGATISRDLGSGRAVALYGNASRSGGRNIWTVSPNFSFPFGQDMGAYVEAGHTSGGDGASTVAGGGLTWLLHEHVQFDLYALHGLTSRSPDLQAGFGVSAFWD
jgi:hypothetical protein